MLRAPNRLFFCVALSAAPALALLPGCLRVHVDPIEATLNINVKVDRELDDFFSGVKEKAQTLDQTPTGDTGSPPPPLVTGTNAQGGGPLISPNGPAVTLPATEPIPLPPPPPSSRPVPIE